MGAIGMVLAMQVANAQVVGDRVQLTSDTNVRPSAGSTTVTCTHSAGKQGVVTGGPVTASLSGTSYQWMQVNWDSSSCDGWSIRSNMSVISLPAQLL